jgi:4-amino-4-deoxy-L-arabinose transferase-like glycosyltransferase
MLISGWAYLVCLLWKNGKPAIAIATGLAFGYLCLTKVIFGYLLAIALLFTGAWATISKRRQVVALASSFVVAALFCVPYLGYTNSISGKIFHWADMGAYNLYWMSSPYPEDSGDWHSYVAVATREELAPHRPFFDRLNRIPHQDRARALTEKAVEQIKANPAKYLQNWMANVGRTLFNYPYDYKPQTLRTYFYIFANGVVLYFLTRSISLIRQHRLRLSPELVLLVSSAFIVYGGTTLVFANPRIVRPLLFLVFPAMIVTLMRASRGQADSS